MQFLGTTCENDVDECASNPCPANAQCTNTFGSFNCTCNSQFRFELSVNDLYSSACELCCMPSDAQNFFAKHC